MRKQRVTEDEISAVLPAIGKSDLSEVRSVVLETDGPMTVVPKAAMYLTAILQLAHAGNSAGACNFEATLRGSDGHKSEANATQSMRTSSSGTQIPLRAFNAYMQTLNNPLTNFP